MRAICQPSGHHGPGPAQPEQVHKEEGRIVESRAPLGRLGLEVQESTLSFPLTCCSSVSAPGLGAFSGQNTSEPSIPLGSLGLMEGGPGSNQIQTGHLSLLSSFLGSHCCMCHLFLMHPPCWSLKPQALCVFSHPVSCSPTIAAGLARSCQFVCYLLEYVELMYF